MDLNVVEKEVATWAPEDQDRLAAYLTILRLERSSDHAQELTRRLAALEPNLRRKAELLAAHKTFFDGFRG